MTQPNIVFIMADDMGYGDVGCFGATRVPTPNMDRLAEEGMRFTDAHSSSAVCTPSRYSVVTGRYCWRSQLTSGVLGGFGAPLIEPERLTVGSLLRSRGYATAAVGKWHLGLNWRTKEGADLAESTGDSIGWDQDGFNVDYAGPVGGGPTDLGFDYAFGIAGSLDMPPYCYIENGRVVGLPDREKEHYYNQQRKGMQTPDWRDEEVDIAFAQKATAFIRGHVETEPDRPFFLYMTPASPHRPCDIRPDFVVGKSQAGDRGDMVFLFDWVVGQVMEALDDLGVAENTLLIATSDNGARATCADGEDYGHRSCGDWRGQKADIWDGGHREPFLARWPTRVRPGTVCDELVCLGDFAATCADLVGEDLAEDAAEDSFSFLPALLGEDPSASSREYLIHHSLDGMFSVRKGNWKLIEGLGSGGFTQPKRMDPEPDDPPGQLYDLDTDPQESTNMWLERPEIVRELREILERCRREGRSRS